MELYHLREYLDIGGLIREQDRIQLIFQIANDS